MSNRCLRIHAPGDLRAEVISMPVVAEDEAGVRVRYVALCGSDLKLYAGTYKAPHTYPVVLGHEWVGEIETVTPAAAAAGWKLGETLTGDCSIFCGECAGCAKDPNHCLTIEKRGITRDGGCAEHIAVPYRHLHRCPGGVDLKAYALTEPVSVAVQGILNRVPHERIGAAQNVLIAGCGGIAISSLLTLLKFKIPSITIADPIGAKTALVSSFGLSNVVTAAALPESGRFDLIVEASGSPESLQKAMDLAAPTGMIICLGHQGTVDLNCGALIQKSLTLVGSIGSSGGFDQAIEIIRAHTDLVSRMITRIVPLSQAEAFFRDDLHSEVNIKMLIDLDS
jgi:threonine dehydrogenase-like Zn-dependent dehydrogenase